MEPRSPFRLAVPIQIRFRDTDAMRHVNNAVYLSYLEVARAAYWQRVFGLQSYDQVDFILARTEIDFVAPVFVGDACEVWLRVNAIGRKSFRFAYEVHASGRLAARAESVQVMYDYATDTTKPMTAAQRAVILAFEEPGAVATGS